MDLLPSRAVPALTRRRFLTMAGGVLAAPTLLAACGGDDTASDAGDPGDGDVEGLALVQYFAGPMFVAGTEVRAPFAVADVDGPLATEDSPGELSVALLDAAGDPVGGPFEVARHADGLARPYYPLRFEVSEPGIYTARAEVAGAAAEMAIQVDEAASVTIPRPGVALPALQTPTTDDPRGVTPICTRSPACDLHEVTVAGALDEARPLALLVATPAFCQISICGPVLDLLLEAAPEHPDVRFVHVEVYADPNGEGGLERFAPAVQELGLHYEPVLVLAGADGTVRERLDTIYDREELGAALGRLTAGS